MPGLDTFLYVSCGETQEILRFRLDPASGELRRCGATRLPRAPDPRTVDESKAAPNLRSNGAPLAIHPDRTVLYAATRASPCRVLSYRISPTDGDLALIGEAPIPEGTPYIATDRSGRYLAGAAYHRNCIWVSKIEGNGAVLSQPVQQIGNLTTTHSVRFHPNNRIAYVGATGMPSIQVFRLSDGARPWGAPIDTPVSAADATPRHLALHSDDRFLYCMNETTSIVDVFAIGGEGAELTAIQSSDLRPPELRDRPGLGADILVSADGRFLYCCERKRGTIAGFAIDRSTGFLSSIQTVEAGTIPRSLAIDPTGRFLVAALQGDGVIRVYAVNPEDGRLTHCATHETGGTPIWVEFVALP